jgi:hypothetical protein
MTTTGAIEYSRFDAILKGLSDYLSSIPPILVPGHSQMDTCEKAEEYGNEAVSIMDDLDANSRSIMINSMVDLSVNDVIYFTDLLGL